jgi:hypothetical protein
MTADFYKKCWLPFFMEKLFLNSKPFQNDTVNSLQQARRHFFLLKVKKTIRDPLKKRAKIVKSLILEIKVGKIKLSII